MKNKQIMMAVGALVVLLLVAGGAFAYTKFTTKPKETAQEQPKKKKIADPVNVLAVDQRPYVQISPVADGRNLELIVKEVKKAATEAEYELEYQAGSLLQGAFGSVSLDKAPAQVKILLGSCSAGGACTYHEDVKGGTLLTRFKGSENYALKSEWKYIDNRAKATVHTSKDAKFSLNSAELKSQRYLIIFNSPGYPKGLEGKVVSDPYSLAASSSLKGKGELTIEANEEGSLAIMGWDGSTWKKFETTVQGKTAKASVDLLELYIVVAQ